MNVAQITHGMSGTETYKSWCRMKNRCLNKNDTLYPKYGARGIIICDRWMRFEGFYKDMGKAPEGYTIDRLNPVGRYEKSNCRWATKFQQDSENKTDLRIIEYKGRSMNVSAWERELGFKNSTILARLNRGWSVERSLTTPLKKYKGYTYDRKRKKFRVYIKRNRNQIFVGRYDTRQEAIKARLNYLNSLNE